eukprot:63075_1
MGNEPTAEGHQMPNPQTPQPNKQRASHPTKQAKSQQAYEPPKHVNQHPNESQEKPAVSKYNNPHPHQQYQSIKSHTNGHNHNTHNTHNSNGYKHNTHNTISPAMTNVTNTNHNNHINPHHHQNIISKKEVVQVHKVVQKVHNKEEDKDKDKDKDAKHFKLSTKMSISDFEIKKLVGRGSFGEVWQVELKKTRQIYALKILKKKDLVARKQVTHTNTERRILANIDHPFLVSLRYAFQTKAKLFMVMDFFNGG